MTWFIGARCIMQQRVHGFAAREIQWGWGLISPKPKGFTKKVVLSKKFQFSVFL